MGLNRTQWDSIGLAGATRLTRSDYRLNLLLLKGQKYEIKYKKSFFLIL